MTNRSSWRRLARQPARETGGGAKVLQFRRTTLARQFRSHVPIERDGGAAWLNSATTLARLNWVAQLLSGNELTGLPAYDPARWLKAGGIDSGEAINTYSTLLLQNDLNPATQKLAARVTAGPKPQLPAALQVLLQSPEYQLA